MLCVNYISINLKKKKKRKHKVYNKEHRDNSLAILEEN